MIGNPDPEYASYGNIILWNNCLGGGKFNFFLFLYNKCTFDLSFIDYCDMYR